MPYPTLILTIRYKRNKESMQILVEIDLALRIFLPSIFRDSDMYTRREIVVCRVS